MSEKTTNIWPDELKDYMNGHNEKDYLLVDVRQPPEYTREHIPGAELVPLNALMADAGRLPKDKDLVFYCAHGMRSRAASDRCVESGEYSRKLFSLMGGIAAWDAEVVADFPRLALFDNLDNTDDVMKTAMNLEKGAFLFYSYLIDKCAGKPFVSSFEEIASMETAHARLIFNLFARDERSTTLFQDIYGSLSGDVIEGGKPLEAVCGQLERMPGEFLANALDMALSIEFAAYDLYRSLANKSEDDAVQQAFLTLAQAEKKHVNRVAGLFDFAFEVR